MNAVPDLVETAAEALREFLSEAREFVWVAERRCVRFSAADITVQRTQRAVRIAIEAASVLIEGQWTWARSSHRFTLKSRGTRVVLLKPSRRNELWLRREQFRWMVEGSVRQRWELLRSSYLPRSAGGSPFLRLVLRNRGRLLVGIATSDEDAVQPETLLSQLFALWKRQETARRPCVDGGVLLVSPARAEPSSRLLADLRGPVSIHTLPGLAPFRSRSPGPDVLLWPSPGSQLELQRLHAELGLPREVRAVVRHGSSWCFEYLGMPFAVLNVNRRAWTFPLQDEPAVPDGEPARSRVRTECLRVREARHARPSRRQEPLFLLYAERWLESLIVQNPKAIGPELRASHVYSQVPAYEARRRVIDLVAVTEGGRLVVIEVKAEKSLDLVFQGLAYWRIVWQAQGRDAFHQNGYFPDIELSPEAPLLYCVTPLLALHPSARGLAERLRAPVEAHLIGINTGWRNGVQVLRRELLAGG